MGDVVVSQLGSLKAQIEVVAADSGRMAGQLNAFRSQFHSSVTQVESVIGGSSQGTDRALIDAIAAAQRQVDAAAAALMHASTTARAYSASL